MTANTSNQTLRHALISDTGGPAASGTTFYYNVGSFDSFKPTNSFGPGPADVSKLVQSWQPSELFAIGDLNYNVGSSTTQDISIGQYYNNFIYPYPSPDYLKDEYKSINGNVVENNKKSWPYNIYNFPLGFPNPLNGGQGGSPDEKNHFWGALGNHDYGLAVGYGQSNVTPYNIKGKPIGNPVGPSSAATVKASIDYFLPFLEKPSLLGDTQNRLNVGAVDTTGNQGAYYSISFGGTPNAPLIEYFQLDTERLNINAGHEKWNPSGMKLEQKIGDNYAYYDTIVPKEIDINYKQFQLNYDPSNPSSLPFPGTTSPDEKSRKNGYDQFLWLKESLAKSNAKWKVITGHHPIYASGRWGDDQPDDHMSNPYLQRLLNALPEGSFDAYYNGHDHFYERVLEGKDGGIGLGIPFITNGNSGRNLEKKIQVEYGTSVYHPKEWERKKDGKKNPNEPALNYLLDSNPLEVGASGLSGDGSKDNTNGFSNGEYGYGFGATQVEANDSYLLFRYQEAPIVDPAIANHLSDGIAPEAGFAGTTAKDWIPDPSGTFNGINDLACFELTIIDGVVKDIKNIKGGRGYMSTKGGNHYISGFNIYGNNIDPLSPWLGTAQVDLSFVDGQLKDVILTDGGSSYELAVRAAAEDNTKNTTEGLEYPIRVAINYNLEEIQYLVRDPELYNDYYLISDTSLECQSKDIGNFGGLQLALKPSSTKAQDLLASLPATTGYSGKGAQRSYGAPQQGLVQAKDHNGTIIAGGLSRPLQDGVTFLEFTTRPAPGQVKVDFGGDPLSSYLVNFREASKSIDLSYGSWSSGLSQASTSSINFAKDVSLSLVRTDALDRSISLGLLRKGETNPTLLITNAKAASNSALNTNSIFIPSGSGSWLATEGQRLGSTSTSLAMLAAGEWNPVARNAAGENLSVESMSISGNSVDVEFTGGIRALYNTSGTGIAQSIPGSGKLAVTVQRLGRQNNGLAFYEADPVTGAVIVNGQSFIPGDTGYLQAALASAKSDGLYLTPDKLPGYGGERVITDLPLDASQNYGLLLLRNNNASDLVSSYSQANPDGAVGMLSFVAPNRGILYGIEDLIASKSDSDYNDLIVGISSETFSLA
ncbi:MAG: hypothetical protein RLZZ430_734 [Cyanobacteriota bacterium]|jgi:hypothetical protein